MIITFYSYKGGVGRSMAVANIATILAREYGRRVIVVDWDLEAPRSHRFFGIPNNEVGSGVIDFLYEYKKLLAGGNEPITMDALPKVEDFITPIPSDSSQKGELWLMPAGKQDSFYADRVNDFDWTNFYEKWNGGLYIEYMKRKLGDIADYIIVDSRTGITDIGGICTLQLPDAVVLFFASNKQNVEGVERMALNLRKNPIIKEMDKNIIIIPVPARIETIMEYDNLNEWTGKYLYNRDSVPEGNNEKLIGFLKDDFDIGWAKDAEIRKSDDGMTILISKDNENSAEILIDEKKENAILKISDGRTYDLKVKTENGKLNIYKEWFSKYLPDYIGSDTFFKNVTIPYIPKFSFGEQIAVNIRGEDGTNPALISHAYYKLAEYIIEISIKYFKKEIEEEKRSKIEIAYIYRDFGSLEQFRGNNATALNCYNKTLEIFEALKEEEGYKPDKQVMVYIISNTAKLYMDKVGLMDTMTLGRYAQAFKIYEELNDKTGALQTFNDISPDPDDTVDILSDCIKIKPYLRDEAANILCVVSKFNLHPDLVLPTLNHLADSVVPAAKDKALDILEQVKNVRPEDANPILERLINPGTPFTIPFIIPSIKDRAESILYKNGRKRNERLRKKNIHK